MPSPHGICSSLALHSPHAPFLVTSTGSSGPKLKLSVAPRIMEFFPLVFCVDTNASPQATTAAPGGERLYPQLKGDMIQGYQCLPWLDMWRVLTVVCSFVVLHSSIIGRLDGRWFSGKPPQCFSCRGLGRMYAAYKVHSTPWSTRGKETEISWSFSR